MTFEELRKRAKLSSSEAAKQLNIQSQAIWRYEHMNRIPKKEILKNMLLVYRCTEEDLGKAIVFNVKKI